MAGEQMARMQHCTMQFLNEAPVRYAEELIARLPLEVDWVVRLVDSVTEAVDLACAMARAHTGHFHMVALRGACHGLRLRAPGRGASHAYRRVDTSMQGFVHAIHPDPYRGAFGPDAGIGPYLSELEQTILCSTAGRIAGMPFFDGVGGNPVSAAAARSVLHVIDDEALQTNAEVRGEQLIAGLRTLQDRHPLVGDVRGTGLFLGVELVEDRGSRRPAAGACDRVRGRMREAGFIIDNGGAARNVLRINPPLCVTEDDCDALLDALDRALVAER